MALRLVEIRCCSRVIQPKRQLPGSRSESQSQLWFSCNTLNGYEADYQDRLHIGVELGNTIADISYFKL
jgi:hypothetical protein